MLAKVQILFICLSIGLAAGCSESDSTTSTQATDLRKDLEPPASLKKDSPEQETKPESPELATSSTEPSWGHLRGRFTYGGDVPPATKLVITKDQAVCGKHDLFDESLVVNPDNKGIQNVVVWLYQKRGGKKPAIHESYEKTANAKVNLNNASCRFDGHVVGVRTSQTLLIRNLDAVGHNTKIDSSSNASINPMLTAHSELEHKFNEAERVPVPVSCSIHPWMNGYVVVQDHPYFAVSNDNGEFEIKNLPSGNLTFQVWHEKTGYITEVEIGGEEKTWKKGRFEQQITTTSADLGDIMVAAEQLK